MNPTAFICHASEDKERFAIKFTEKLRANGVDAWLDKWELLPGDDLIEKIFEEGIGKTNSMIIILSKYSINKQWVRKELNTGIIKRIEKGTKIIPVVLDECEVPECLRSIVRVKIHDCNSYENEFRKILFSIFGTTEKPELGTMPNQIMKPHLNIKLQRKVAVHQLPEFLRKPPINMEAPIKHAISVDIENHSTGKVFIKEFYVQIPNQQKLVFLYDGITKDSISRVTIDSGQKFSFHITTDYLKNGPKEIENYGDFFVVTDIGYEFVVSAKIFQEHLISLRKDEAEKY